jgi:hypothetical protein
MSIAANLTTGIVPAAAGWTIAWLMTATVPEPRRHPE